MLSERLCRLNLPKLLSRDEMLNILQSEVYGFIPKKPDSILFSEQKDFIPNFCAGKASCTKVIAECIFGDKSISFPFYVSVPSKGGKHPFFIHINFRADVFDMYQPTEEIIDNGFALLSFGYKDITDDNGDFTDGLADVLCADGKRKTGKLALWAWAAQRVMDYAETKSEVLDTDCAVVCGHSRLGKTALLTAATDTRFAFAYSNDSGCSGAALSRTKSGERIADICKNFPYWFCDRYQQYIGREDEMPFDQHFLVSCIAPHKVLVGSASEDDWASPDSELLCCIASSSAFEKGFIYDENKVADECEFLDGDIGYHRRTGRHCFSRKDWQRLIRFVNLHR